jgi:regulatory protein
VEEDNALEAAISLLAASAKTEVEVTRRLRQKGHSQEQVSAAVERLRARGLLDDRSLAQHLVERRAGEGRRGRLRVAAELTARGLSRELVSEALSGWNNESERVAAVAAARKWIRSRTRGGADAPRVVAYLARQGFAPALARSAAQEALAPTAEVEPAGTRVTGDG